LSPVMMLSQLGMATAMVKSAAHATGVAASGMNSDNLGARGGGEIVRITTVFKTSSLILSNQIYATQKSRGKKQQPVKLN
jgi:hypothetical protein